MAFDQPTRNRLASFVGKARALLTEEFTRQLQHEYGLDPADGDVAELAKLTGLDDARRETARVLRDTLAHYLGCPADKVREAKKKARQETLERIVREQAFTVLNRLCALRMAEARELLLESISRGYQSRGFQLYARLAGSALGETGNAYRTYLFSLCDEFAVDLPVLFDRFSPQGRLFPREAALLALLNLVNAPELAGLWAEDETIGWIYQYFNSKEERQAMRAESGAPRNSRELAVRNQFFTPRYVVEFLTDNTLGRIWYEMTQGQTSLRESCRYLVRRPTEIFLAEGEERSGGAEEQGGGGEKELSQEELLRQPVYIPHRPLKDPRDILMLDPACGSMHFGLYAFDLYERIYDEAWELEERLGPDAFVRSEGLLPLHASYPDKAAFLRDVPRLIIERNIHGIDIDPRAVQIAGLSLWLRGQRSWQAQGVKPQDRPQIRRSNIVCAEPMPGNEALLEEFLKSLRADRLESLIRRVLDVPTNQRVRATPIMADALCGLVRTVWKEMALAGEAGSLLKIEEALTDAIARSKAEWEERTLPLFRVQAFGLTEEQPKVSYVKALPGDEEDFWKRAEGLVLAALEEYAARAENGGGYTRRLFAGDAARGFAFIDLCRKRYDIVLMNPPFGSASIQTRQYLSEAYPKLWGDIYAAFVDRATVLLVDSGWVGAITSRTFLALSSFESLRELLLDVAQIRLVVECGLGVLDNATVRAAFFVAERVNTDDRAISFWDLRQSDDREGDLLAALSGNDAEQSFIVSPARFRDIPGKPFAYWLPERLMRLLGEGPHLDEERSSTTPADTLAHVAVGASTTDDMRFVRCHWEVLPEQMNLSGWVRFAHAVGFARYYSPTYVLLKWFGSGKELLSVTDERGNTKPRLRCREYFFRPGLVSPYISERGLGCSYLSSDHIVSNSCRAYFDLKYDAGALLAYLNSRLADLFIWALTPDRKHEAGIIAALPVPTELSSISTRLSELAGVCWRAMLTMRSTDETDPLHSATLLGLTRRYELAQHEYRQAQEEVDGLVDSLVLRSDLIARVMQKSGAPHDLGGWESDDGESDDAIGSSRHPRNLLTELPTILMSTTIGVCLGRWNVRLVMGEEPKLEVCDPFTSLPLCPPAMLQNIKGLPAAPGDVPVDYPLRISWLGILTDDEGHSEDIERRVREALHVIWGDRADAIEAEACEILGVRTLRDYFRKPAAFFADHLKRYSKSRRQAPIYWPLATPSGSYTLWLYYHRLSDQTLYACVNDFVEPKLAAVGGQLAALRRKSGRSRQEEQDLEQLADLELELRDFRDELERIARFWRPNLNDGVQITAAPLWRLFQHRPWQKTLKETWEKLEAGDYDWAHLALSIWPERVVPKCVTDRSLAIAHDLENLFWVEDGGRWRNLSTPDEEIAEQKRRQQLPPRERLRLLLGELTQGRARGLRADQVHQHLKDEDWDDLELTLLLWPERMAAKCWDDPLLAQTLDVKLPAKRTKAAFERFRAERVAAGCPDLAEPLLAALQDRGERFAALWAELARGDRDDVAIALALWPDRVVDKCAKDVELAEQHGLRRFLWMQDQGGAWRRRKTPKEEVTSEIARRGRS